MNESIIAEITRLDQELKSLLPMKQEDQQRLDKKFRLEFNYNSNHIEGNTLTYGETELLLIFGETKGNHNIREYEEMEAHDVAFSLVRQWAEDKEYPLTEMGIKNLNKTILVKPYWKEAITPDGQETRRQIKIGEYKEHPNSVRLQNGEIFNYASPQDTPIMMGELIQWFREAEQNMSIHPIELAALLHYRFVLIHPFDDGNGRISRLLLNYVLLKNGFPPVIIKSEDKKNYLSALHLADVGDMEAFVEYIGNQLYWSLNINIKAARNESIEETGDYLKEIKLLEKKIATKGSIRRSPQITYSVYTNVEENLWRKIEDCLNDFNGLFNGTNDIRYINGLPKSLPKPKTSISLFEMFSQKNDADRIKIFGVDIFDKHVPITRIKWENIKYGLTGASEVINYTIALELDLGLDKYLITLSVSKSYQNQSIFELSKFYDDFILNEEINQFLERLKDHFLEDIKKMLNHP